MRIENLVNKRTNEIQKKNSCNIKKYQETRQAMFTEIHTNTVNLNQYCNIKIYDKFYTY